MKVAINCGVCGIEIMVYPYEARTGHRRFCSGECRKSGKTGRHNESGARIYSIWCCMKNRCNCQTAPAYQYYGARGISVCRDWNESYESFRDWATASGYLEGLELDRKDVNGNYEPGNCRWATRTQQMQNTRARNQKNKSSAFKGVAACANSGNPWRVTICVNKKMIHVGVFSSEIEAARAYDAAARKHFGEFAHLNFA